MKRIAPFCLALLAASCATDPKLKGHSDLLGFLEDGKTTKAEALLKLGQPSGKFESEKALTYRLGFSKGNQGYYVLERPEYITGWSGWVGAKYSLVLVFDEAGVLRQHALVEVN